MEYIYVGKLVNTHGLKGEMKILSDFNKKNEVLKKGTILYVEKNKQKLTINSSRPHQQYILLTFEGINSIEESLKYKGTNIYINRSDFENIEYFDEELVGFDLYLTNKIGTVEEIRKGKKYDYLVVGKNLIPNIKEFIKKIDVVNKKIYIHNWEGLIDED